MFFPIVRSKTASFLAGFTVISAALGLLATTGCGIGAISTTPIASSLIESAPNSMTGMLHGAPNPVGGATITLYTTSATYGGAANQVATTTTAGDGSFQLSLPTSSVACPKGSYAYVGAYGGSTGGAAANPNSLLMVPIGLCDNNYTVTGTAAPYTNTYIGSSLWIDELTTAVSAYALSGFMTVTNAGAINIGAPPSNTATSCAGLATATLTVSSGVITNLVLLSPNGCPYTTAPTVTFTTPISGSGATATSTINSAGIITSVTLLTGGSGYSSTASYLPVANIAPPPVSVQAAGLAHAFANALALVSNHTGQPFAYTRSGTSTTTGGTIPVAELYLMGNILQSCVNSTGITGTNTAISNDGSHCGKFFSYVTPPQTGAAVPTNTMQAMLDLVKYPKPAVNTWDSNCVTAGGGTNTATSCLFALAPGVGAPYPNALQTAPPDWTLAVVYSSGYGSASGNPGITYPYYVAMDYQDNVYVINWSAGTAAWTNLLGFGFDGTPLFTTVEDKQNLNIQTIATDTAGHIVAPNGLSNPANVPVYSASTGAVVNAGTGAFTSSAPKAIAIDPANNVYLAPQSTGLNLRKLAYGGTSAAPTYVVSTPTSYAAAYIPYQMGFDANLDLWQITGGATTTDVYFFPNGGTSLNTPALVGSGTPNPNPLTITGSSSSAAGIAVGSGNVAYALDSAGITPLTKVSNAAVAGTPVAIPAVNGGVLYNRYALADGNNWVYSPDSANGTQVSGVSVFDATDSLALGTYMGCFVTTVSGTTQCGTATATSPIYSPRAIALDSSGDIWVVSGAAQTMTELIGAAAPTWPGLSTARFGLPQ